MITWLSTYWYKTNFALWKIQEHKIWLNQILVGVPVLSQCIVLLFCFSVNTYTNTSKAKGWNQRSHYYKFNENELFTCANDLFVLDVFFAYFVIIQPFWLLKKNWLFTFSLTFHWTKTIIFQMFYVSRREYLFKDYEKKI